MNAGANWKPFWLQAVAAVQNPLEYLTGNARYGGIVEVRKNVCYQLNDPEFIGHVLQTNHQNYGKGPRYRRAVEPLFGNGLPTTDGEFWKRQRRLMQPAFLRKHHELFAATMIECTREMIGRWMATAQSGGRLNVREEMMALSLRSLLRCVFGQERPDDLRHVGQALLAIQNEINLAEQFNPLRLPDFVPTPGRRRIRRALNEINPFIARMVEARRKLGPNENDVASLLLFSREEETGKGMPEAQLRDEIVTIMATGHDSVSEAMTWTLYLLGRHPEVYRRVAEEVRAALDKESLGPDLVAKLTYTRMTLEECMRFYPPIWGMMRTALGDDTIGGYPIRAGTRILLSQYVVHRLPSLWEQPERFEPERFSPERSAARHRFAYFPFGAGPRQCLGASFAMLEMGLILALLLQAFDLEVQDGPEPRPVPRVSLKPDRPIWLRVTGRG
jgi:cytochrome P450